MRYSQLLIPTVKEVPADAEVPSHRLMIRSGYIRKVASGTYTYLVLGARCLQKIEQIVREEMNASDAQEVIVPILQPTELWEQTGRRDDYGETLFCFKDRHGRMNTLAPTAEEVMTFHVANEISSYKQLPINLYQINWKFRDEFRPRFGVLRSREFLMKDAYSFDATAEGLDVSYQKMYDGYCRIFSRCGLQYVAVEAESGPIGGSASHEFMIPCSAGEDIIAHTEDFSYAANIEKAEVDAMAPPEGLAAAREAVGAIEEVHTPDVGSIEAVCAFLETRPEQMIKTLVFSSDGEVVIALVRGDHEINEAKLHRAADIPGLELADEGTIQKITGAAVGFAGPMGLAGKVARVLVDPAVAVMASGVTGANKTDYHVKNVVPGRDFPLDGANVCVVDIRNATEADSHEGRPLQFSRGVEVGHVFKLGTKYSDALGAKFLDEHGKETSCIMGCYGIGLTRILAGAIELNFDDNGFVLPISIAPFHVEVIPLNMDSEAVMAEARRIYDELTAAGVEVLLDDRQARPGVKFKDADLIGIPVRVVVGDRGLAEGNVEVKRRTDPKPTLVAKDQAVADVQAILRELWAEIK